MKLSLSEISTVYASFEEDVAAYAAVGFDGIGIWEMKLPADDEANVRLLREARLAVANCVPTVPSILPLLLPGMEGPPDPEERVTALCASIRRFAAFEPGSVVCLTGAVGDLDSAEARKVAVAGLREAAAAASEVGVRLGLEPAGASVSIVATVVDALTLLEEAGLGDVGIMADTHNLWDETPEALVAEPGRITGLHVADRPREAGREDRVLPGEGGTRSAEHVRALAEAGWDGFLDVEIFSTPERFWGLSVDEAARRAYAAVRALRSPQ
ncbi:MAG: sugar phosphate isomerase/epimerase [Actinomycetota bacterium]|nr:sugar phosphate isomerase/epimerase [Actinomycetota bacterium]